MRKGQANLPARRSDVNGRPSEATKLADGDGCAQHAARQKRERRRRRRLAAGAAKFCFVYSRVSALRKGHTNLRRIVPILMSILEGITWPDGDGRAQPCRAAVPLHQIVCTFRFARATLARGPC